MSYHDNKHEPIVYYAIRKDFPAAIKIGTTVNITERMKRLSRRTSYEYVVLAYEPGNMSLESQRHTQFRSLNICGEWFYNEGELKSFVSQLKKDNL